MTFLEVISSIPKNYFNFEGRASRSEYWYFFLFCFLIGIVVNLLVATIPDLNLLPIIIGLILLIPGISFGVRRLHDTNRSGWWILIALIPIIGVIILIIFFLIPGDNGSNDFGMPPR